MSSTFLSPSSSKLPNGLGTAQRRSVYRPLTACISLGLWETYASFLISEAVSSFRRLFSCHSAQIELEESTMYFSNRFLFFPLIFFPDSAAYCPLSKITFAVCTCTMTLAC